MTNKEIQKFIHSVLVLFGIGCTLVMVADLTVGIFTKQWNASIIFLSLAGIITVLIIEPHIKER